MSDINLLDLQSGYNFNRMNFNFDLLEATVNEVLFHRDGGNNVMGQAIDMDSNRIVNLIDPFSRHEPATKGYVDDIALGGSVPVVMPQTPYQIIDMNNDDYTMTDLEASSVGKIIVNSVAGKVLTFPSTSDDFAPQKQTLVNLGGEPGFLIASETGGSMATVMTSPDITDFAYFAGAGVFVINNNKILSRTVSGIFYDVELKDRGCIISCINDSETVINIEDVLATPGFNFIVTQEGEGRVVFEGSANLIGSDGVFGTNGKGSVVHFYTTHDTIGDFIVTGNMGYSTDDLTINSGEVFWDLRTSKEHFNLLLTEHVDTITIANLPPEKNVTRMLKIVQDATTPYTVDFPANFKWIGGLPGLVSTDLGAEDLLAISTFDGGTTWYATLAKDFS